VAAPRPPAPPLPLAGEGGRGGRKVGLQRKPLGGRSGPPKTKGLPEPPHSNHDRRALRAHARRLGPTTMPGDRRSPYGRPRPSVPRNCATTTPGVILLFRVGSFYEILFEDAELVARELGLKLGGATLRRLLATRAPSGGFRPPRPRRLPATPLVTRLSRSPVCEESGRRSRRPRAAAACAQRDGRAHPQRPAPSPIRALLREDRPTYLVAIAPLGERLGIAWTDVAAGEFKAAELDPDEAAAELQRLEPAEVIVSVDRPRFPRRSLPVARSPPFGPSEDAVSRLQRAFPDNQPLGSGPPPRSPPALIVGYLEETQGAESACPRQPPTPAASDDAMRLDAVTQRHLELVETERAPRERAGSLLGTPRSNCHPDGAAACSATGSCAPSSIPQDRRAPADRRRASGNPVAPRRSRRASRRPSPISNGWPAAPSAPPVPPLDGPPCRLARPPPHSPGLARDHR